MTFPEHRYHSNCGLIHLAAQWNRRYGWLSLEPNPSGWFVNIIPVPCCRILLFGLHISVGHPSSPSSWTVSSVVGLAEWIGVWLFLQRGWSFIQLLTLRPPLTVTRIMPGPVHHEEQWCSYSGRAGCSGGIPAGRLYLLYFLCQEELTDLAPNHRDFQLLRG